ncbi:RGS13 [Acrasis kona]|uniref:RGS13 n=1 Tax=Acrasis kona TaxID=1008807 RepID=A0AAW2YRS8_9EUKA
MNKVDEVADIMINYDIHFENIIDNNELRDCFAEYLTKIHNINPLLLLIELGKYMTCVGCCAKYNAAKKIITEFIEVNSPKEVNVSNKLRQTFFEAFSHCDESKCPSDLFDELRVNIYMELKADCLPGFIASPQLAKHIKKVLKKNPDYLSQIGSPKTVVRNPSSPTIRSKKIGLDDNRLQITDEDFDQVLAYIKFQDADVHGETNISKFYHDLVTRGVKVAREDITINYKSDEVFNSLLGSTEGLVKMDSYQKTSVEFFEDSVCEKYKTFQYRSTMTCGFPLGNRDFSVIASARREPDGSILVVRKSASNPLIPVHKDYIRGSIVQGHLFENVKGHCRFLSINLIDLSGSVKTSAINKIHRAKKG